MVTMLSYCSDISSPNVSRKSCPRFEAGSLDNQSRGEAGCAVVYWISIYSLMFDQYSVQVLVVNVGAWVVEFNAVRLLAPPSSTKGALGDEAEFEKRVALKTPVGCEDKIFLG